MTKNDKLEILIKQPDDQTAGEPGWLTQAGEGELLLDVCQDKNNIYVVSAIAGAKPEDLEIALNNDMLTIRGQRQQDSEVEEKDFFYRECYWGSFSRSIILPTEIKADKISAVLKNGVLTVTLPKAKNRQNIPIKISEE
ncbi:MAG: hypothetical protein A2729_05645 [Candidatus Buchananbacteria bacterium RIFCSPHIGHO2_01_FULL_39_14]|uniref:SHSP domain-containing protein n=2 Tax=Candidatus Buchananiibacteriota TaxID=1817903 RepID=A0A1G1YSR1_9BACT|nr:MAG: hypothetical protein A2729_05645 [Candidatus Buchananbacteria bacterium RIFCSPHIGHO2_01_FULL_39_14]OGY48451.1 MAG: hypothetical protein A3D39_02460 [Candidatus Buchananbacteria bacterium RIFCSPHIGHO2_02_FULL_39_17]OGY55309.1 MAG: hypothetical protein A2912_02625 [Candidatus Buchananbacteria bacterium RIFCSPLOWO2_01_FULL_40_23b]